MRSVLLITSALLLSALTCPANTLTDTFGQSQGNCNYGPNPPYGNCDVVGDPLLYDIQSANFFTGGGLATVLIYLNSGAVSKVNNQLVLGPFNDAGVTLIPGDIFFYSPDASYDPSDPATSQYLQYGVAVTSHGSFVAGDLYNITGGVGVEIAQTALNNSDDYYRKNEDVLLSGSGAPASSGTINVSNNHGNGDTSAEYLITVTFPTTTAFLDLIDNGQIGLLFSSADCGNDVIQGVLGTIAVQNTPAPEPGPAALVFMGIGLLIAGSVWRKRTA